VNASLFLARLALIGTFASCNVLAVSAEATLSGTLLDPQGAAVPNAVIDLRWNDTSGEMCWTAPHCRKQRRPHKRFLHVRTDNAGRFSMELSPGNYDVFAHLDGFAPTCTEVSAEADKTTTIELRFPRYVVTSVQ